MAQRAAVPKFGNWGAEQNIGYTMYFDNARKGRGGAKPGNPNDPQESPYLVSEDSRPSQSRPTTGTPHEPKGHGLGNRVAQEQRTRADPGDGRRSSNPLARHNNNASDRTNHSNMKPQNLGSAGGPNYGELRKRTGKVSNGPEYRSQQSPLHDQGKAPGRSPVGSPAREGKGLYEGSYGTPVRSRMRPLSQDGTNDRGHALPKFGDWDVKNAGAGDGYTQIFNKVREEKHQRGNIGMTPSPGRFQESPYRGPRKLSNTDDPMGGCCFLWGRK